MKLHELESLFITKLSEKYSLTKPVLKKVFHKFDRDGSGYLSVTELSQAIASFINGVDMTLIQELVRHYDVDQDGTINLDEFCHFLLSKDGTNPTTWLTTNTSNERPSSRSSSRSNQEPQNISTSTQRNLTKQQQQRQQEEEEASTQHRIEHQAKLFLQGMKSILMKNILENRESGKIPKRERLSQKTSQLILTQSKALLQKLFAPYETSSNSQGIPLNGFKRILSKFIPSGSMVYGDDVFEYLYDVCRDSEEEGARADILYSLIFDTGAVVENKFGFAQEIPAVTETGRPNVGKGPFEQAGVDAMLKVSSGRSSVVATQLSDVPLRFMTRRSKTTLAVPSNFDMNILHRSSQYPPFDCEREFVFGLKTDLYSGRPFYRYPTHFYAIENDDEVADDDDDGHDKVIYSTAAVGVIHNLSTNTQRTFCGHDDDITCISLAPESFGLVATGQLGRTPYICVWDCSCVPTSQDKHPRLSRFNHSYPVSDTGLVCTLGKGFFQRGVCAVCFTYDAKYICGIGCDDHHALGIWEIQTGTLIAEAACCNGTPPQVSSLTWCPSPQFASYLNKDHNGMADVFCTTGVRHLKFWCFIRPVHQKGTQTSPLTMKTGTMGKISSSPPKTYICSLYLPSNSPTSSTLYTNPGSPTRTSLDMSISAPSILYDTLLGADNGFLYLFHLAVCTRAIDLNPHGINTVSALDLLDNHVYAGGSRGTVLILNPMNNFEVLFVISTLPSQPAAQPTSIIGSTPSPRPGTPSSTKSQGNPQSRPRSSSATRARPSPSNQPQAAGGKSSQVQPTISRKARAKVPSSGWTGPGNRTDESLPAGVKASTDVKGIVLLPRAEGLQKRIEGSVYSSLSSLLVVSGFGKVMEVRVTDRLQFAPPTPLISFAYGTLYGLAVMHPPISTIICAGGDDKWLSLFSIVPGNYRLLTRFRVPSPIRCIDFEAKNIFLAVGMAAGVIGIYFLHKQSQKGRGDRPFERNSDNSSVYTFYELCTRKDCQEDISDIKFSPNSRMLAVGSHDNYIDIYSTSFVYPTLQDSPTCNLQHVRRMKGHTSYLTHLDWSMDNTLLRSTCGAYELLYWTLPAGKMCTSSFDTIEADSVWYTNNCVLGFNIMGIWAPGSDGTDINCVDTSNTLGVVATGDDQDNLCLFTYPCVVKNAPKRIGAGHSSHVMNLKFTSDSSHLITVGGNDNSIIVWKLIAPKH